MKKKPDRRLVLAVLALVAGAAAAKGLEAQKATSPSVHLAASTPWQPSRLR